MREPQYEVKPMTQRNVKERRRSPRIRVDLAAKIDGMDCVLTDISEQGAGITWDTEVPEMSLIGLNGTVELPDQAPLILNTQAVVVRCNKICEGGYLIGLFFLEMSDEMRESVHHFVKRALTSGGADR